MTYLGKSPAMERELSQGMTWSGPKRTGGEVLQFDKPVQ